LLRQTANMEEDYISKLKNVSKLDFQSKVDVINTPELKGLLQTFSYLNVSVICTVCVV